MKKVVKSFSPIFLLLLPTFTSVVWAQSNQDSTNAIKTYFIPQVSDTLNISKSGYYLAEVKDLRTNPSNNGSINIDGVKHSLSFTNGLPLFISSFILPQNPNENLAPLSIQIEKLKCFASSNGKTDEAQLYMKLNFLDPTSSQLIKTFENTFIYKKGSQYDFLSKFMYNSFKLALSGLKNKRLVTRATSTEEKISTGDVKIFRIPLPDNKFSWSNTEYKIQNIKDARMYDKNEGSISVGYFNQMAVAKLDTSLEYYFSNSITTSNESFKKPLTLQIESFRISEEETALGEKGSVFFTANLLIDSIGNKYSIFKNTITFDTVVDLDLSSKWPIIINRTLEVYFTTFNEKEPTLLTFDKKNEEIIAERFYYKHKYYWNGRELKRLKDFNEVINNLDDTELTKKFYSSINYIKAGRMMNYVGFSLLAYSFIDFLLVEDRSIKNWYKSDTYASNYTNKLGFKKLTVLSGFASIITSFVLRKAGKHELLKSVGLYNKSLAKKVSLNFVPNIQKQGYLFQLNYLIGQR